jgi:hypothetical protein
LDPAGALRMRTVLLGALLGVILALGVSAPVRADAGLTAAVAAAYFPRNVDGALHDIAHQRVAESRACGCLDHSRMRPGTAEVLGWNQGKADPISTAIVGWARSSLHHGILSNGSYGRIGCATLLDGGRFWFACVLAAGPLPAGATTVGAAGPVAALPDTATALPSGPATGGRAGLIPI